MEIDVDKIARLAALSLSDQEKELLAEQLPSIFGHFEQIAAIATDDIEPLVTPTEFEHVFREDEVDQWDSAEPALANAPDKSGHLFKVPPVVG